ncbi:MAG: hypothetical protein FWF69_10175 [Firmicutes bacterium]|nr:hypothetical protein [Bacillota bacterium]
MLMPIVSMNKMAMNESVAATCCFKESASPTNVYWTTLNGGWIGQGYVETLDWKVSKRLLNGWTALGYDVKVPNDRYDLVTFPALWKNEATGTWMVDYTGGAIDLDVFFVSQDTIKRGDSCKHDSTNCKYRVWDIVWKQNYHFDSTTKHTNGVDDWTVPHEAKQFNS